MTSLSACHAGSDDNGALPDGACRLYLLNHDRTAVVQETHTVSTDRTDVMAVVEDIANALQSAPVNKEHLAPVSEDAILREYHLEEGLLTLDFDVRYLDMDFATEAVTRAAIVLSFTGIDGVDGVLFLVSGTALMKNETDPVGVMTAESFVLSDRM